MDYKNIIVSLEDQIATVQLNRPHSLNAFNMEMLKELHRAFFKISQDDKIRAMVIKGNEDYFAAGADIREVINYGPLEIREYINLVYKMGLVLLSMTKPTIASISGYCLGGGAELAMSCDIRIASENALFGFPEVNLGIFPAGGGTQRLARIVGQPRARELIMTGDIIDCKTALEYVLINKMVPAQDLEAATKKMARKLSSKSPLVISMIKELLDLSQHLDPFIGSSMEREKFAVLFASEDKDEGMNAFLEGRKPVFTGK